jgi:hypothetical protein
MKSRLRHRPIVSDGEYNRIQRLPPPCQVNSRKRKDDTRLGTAATGMVERLHSLPPTSSIRCWIVWVTQNRHLVTRMHDLKHMRDHGHPLALIQRMGYLSDWTRERWDQATVELMEVPSPGPLLPSGHWPREGCDAHLSRQRLKHVHPEASHLHQCLVWGYTFWHMLCCRHKIFITIMNI